MIFSHSKGGFYNPADSGGVFSNISDSFPTNLLNYFSSVIQ